MRARAGAVEEISAKRGEFGKKGLEESLEALLEDPPHDARDVMRAI